MSSQKSMPVTIPATQVQRKFGEVVRRVFSGREHFIVEKSGLPVIAIISVREYDELMKERERREERLRRFREAARAIGHEVQRQELSEGDVEAKVEEVRQRLHEKHYGAKPAR